MADGERALLRDAANLIASGTPSRRCRSSASARDEDGRDPHALDVQLGLQFEARHSGHADIEDQTPNPVQLI